MGSFRIETERLILREWRETDREPLHTICRDPRVMEFIGPAWTIEECAQFVAAQKEIHLALGYCCWAMQRRADGALLSFCGIKPGTPGTPVEGKPDLGWRLDFPAWGQGFAREAALACIDWGFASLPDKALWAKTVPANARSWGLMLRLGMKRIEGGDFDHPALSEGNPLRRHVLYSINRPQ